MGIETYRYEFRQMKVFMNFERFQGVWGFVFSGALDTEPSSRLFKWVKENCFKRKYNYIVDLNNVNFCSSTAIRLFTAFTKNYNEFVLFSKLAKNIERPFKLIGLDKFLTFYEDLVELPSKFNVSEELIKVMRTQVAETLSFALTRRSWLEILGAYVPREKLMKEAQKLSPYLTEARHSKSLLLPAKYEYIPVVYVFLTRIFYDVAGFSKEEVGEDIIEFIAKELMSNAIRYGYDYRLDGYIEVSYEINQKFLMIDFIDWGKGIGKGAKKKDAIGLHLLKRIFDKIKIGKAPYKVPKGISLGPGTHIRLIKKRK